LGNNLFQTKLINHFSSVHSVFVSWPFSLKSSRIKQSKLKSHSKQKDRGIFEDYEHSYSTFEQKDLGIRIRNAKVYYNPA
jgi:hypothetical protein